MNSRETQGLLAMIKAAYPSFYRDLPKADLLAAVNLWETQFAEFDVNVVKAACQRRDYPGEGGLAGGNRAPSAGPLR